MKDSRMDKEDIDLRFGVVAVQKGFIAKDEIRKALEIQLNEDFSIGKHRLIGIILLDEGLITHTQFDEVLHILLTTRENGTDNVSPSWEAGFPFSGSMNISPCCEKLPLFLSRFSQWTPLPPGGWPRYPRDESSI